MSETRKPMNRWWVWIAAVLAAVVLGWYAGSRVGDESSPAEPAAQNEADGQVHRDVAGRVVRLAPEEGVMTVDHEEIAGFMPAMVMDLQLVDPAEVEGLSPDDEILFDLARIDGTYMAVRIRRAGDQADAPNPGAASVSQSDGLERGDRVPDLELFDARGNRFRLREMEPRHKIITFFYVRCPLQNFCPAQSQRLAELQEHVEEAGSGVHLLSLTLDAEHDGPEVLEGYAERFEADPSRWTLAGSDDPEAVRQFADRAGARIRAHDESFEIDHALIALRVDDDRIVDRVYGLEAIEDLVRRM